MGTLIRCLCLVLTLMMAGSRLGTAIRTLGTSPSRSQWGPDELRALNLKALEATLRADYDASGQLCMPGYVSAQRAGNRWAALRFLIGIAGGQLDASNIRPRLSLTSMPCRWQNRLTTAVSWR